MVVLILCISFFIFIHFLHKEHMVNLHTTRRLNDLKRFRVRNPARNVARIKTCYLKLADKLPKSRKESFTQELERRLDLCEQQLDRRPASLEEAELLLQTVRRGR